MLVPTAFHFFPFPLPQRIELVSPENWAKNFGIAEIEMLKELNKRAPQLLHKTITQVDVLKDSAEQVLTLLTCCFAQGGGVPEPVSCTRPPDRLCVRACLCVRLRIWAYVCVGMRVCARVRLWACARVRLRACVRACVCKRSSA